MSPRLRSADGMIRLLVADPARLAKVKADPLPELEKLKDEAVTNVPMVYIGDVWVYRGVVFVLGAAVLPTLVGALVLQAYARDVPQAIVGLGATALGALAGLLVPSPTGK